MVDGEDGGGGRDLQEILSTKWKEEEKKEIASSDQDPNWDGTTSSERGWSGWAGGPPAQARRARNGKWTGPGWAFQEEVPDMIGPGRLRLFLEKYYLEK